MDARRGDEIQAIEIQFGRNLLTELADQGMPVRFSILGECGEV